MCSIEAMQKIHIYTLEMSEIFIIYDKKGTAWSTDFHGNKRNVIINLRKTDFYLFNVIYIN